MDTVHPDITKPDSVTHFICPKGPTKDGVPVATHHLVPRASKTQPGVRVHICTTCGETEADLAKRDGLR